MDLLRKRLADLTDEETLLYRALGKQIIEKPGEPDHALVPALLTEPDQQAIAAAREPKTMDGVSVSKGHV